MTDETVAAAKVGQDQGSGGNQVGFGNDDITARQAKRKPGSFWFEDGGRYLLRSGPKSITIFDIWVWFGEPLPKRARA